MNEYRVLIVDDHPMARQAVRMMLENAPAFRLVGEASNGEEAVREADRLLPDLILMDIQMPVMNGLESTRQIKKQYPHMKIVMLTVSDDVADLFTAIQYGAQGYLLKNMDPDEWLSYLHALLDDSSDISRQMADRLFHQFRSKGNPDEWQSPSSLTAREKEIVAYVATGQNNKQIAGALSITENTVKNHIKNILDKLALDNRIQLTAYAVKHGLSQGGQHFGPK